MSFLSSAIVLGFTAISLVLILFRVRFRWVLGSILIASQIVCLYEIFLHQPAQIAWLCNVAVFFNIFLLFKFNQTVFDLFFFFSWIGCFFICLMPNNPYSVTIKDSPVTWVGYWIKHITPLIMTIYFIRIEGWRISRWSMYKAVAGFLLYCSITYFYNKAFNQNILYLNEPAPFMEALGKYYFIIIVPIGYYWTANVYLVTLLVGGVKKATQKVFAKVETLDVKNQSAEGS